MRDAQGEEFKHFCMDLEFLLRRTPLWREIAEGILFQEGDIVEHGEEAEEAARRTTRGGRGGAAAIGGGRRSASASLRGAGLMNHLLREHAPITDAGWELLDEEARERLTVRARRAQARRLLRPARLGALGDEPRPRPSRSPSAPVDGVDARRSAACCRWSSCARGSASPARELRDADRGAEDVDLDALDEAARRIALRREHRRLPRLARGRDHRHRARPRTHDADRARRRLRRLPGPRRRGGRDAAARPASRARTGSRSAPTATRGVVETTEHGGYPLFDHLAQDPRRPDRLGAGRRRRGRGEPARRRLPVRVRPGPLDRLRRATTPTRSTSTSRRASASASRRRRPRSRCRPPEPQRPSVLCEIRSQLRIL